MSLGDWKVTIIGGWRGCLQSRNRILNWLSLLIFSLGVLLALALTAVSAWGEYEAALFDSGARADEHLSTLTCPALISPHETGEIKILLANRSEYEVTPEVKAHISAGSALFIWEETQQLVIKPGGSQKLRWPVYAEDAAFKRLVLVRVLVGRSYPLPSSTATCGIVLLDLAGLSGGQMQFGALFLSAACLAGGWLFWSRLHPQHSNRSAELANGMMALSVIALIGALTSFTGGWLVGFLCLAIGLLLGITLFGLYSANVD